jgi:hypothetical protein
MPDFVMVTTHSDKKVKKGNAWNLKVHETFYDPVN